MKRSEKSITPIAWLKTAGARIQAVGRHDGRSRRAAQAVGDSAAAELVSASLRKLEGRLNGCTIDQSAGSPSSFPDKQALIQVGTSAPEGMPARLRRSTARRPK
jgi:hypothetical protein